MLIRHLNNAFGGWLLAILIAFITTALMPAAAIAIFTPPPPDLGPPQSDAPPATVAEPTADGTVNTLIAFETRYSDLARPGNVVILLTGPDGGSPLRPAAQDAPPSRPTFISAQPGGARQTLLVWELADDGGDRIVNFELQRRVGTTENSWSAAGMVSPVPDIRTTWYDSNLQAATQYTYRVRAIDDTGAMSPWSASSPAVTTPAVADEIPAAPDRPTISYTSPTTGHSQGGVWVRIVLPSETGGERFTGATLYRRKSGCGEAYMATDAPLGRPRTYPVNQGRFEHSFNGLEDGIHLYAVSFTNNEREEGPLSLPVAIHTDGTVMPLAWAGNSATCPVR